MDTDRKTDRHRPCQTVSGRGNVLEAVGEEVNGKEQCDRKGDNEYWVQGIGELWHV